MAVDEKTEVDIGDVAITVCTLTNKDTGEGKVALLIHTADKSNTFMIELPCEVAKRIAGEIDLAADAMQFDLPVGSTVQ